MIKYFSPIKKTIMKDSDAILLGLVGIIAVLGVIGVQSGAGKKKRWRDYVFSG